MNLPHVLLPIVFPEERPSVFVLRPSAICVWAEVLLGTEVTLVVMSMKLSFGGMTCWATSALEGAGVILAVMAKK
jgi:hypothetical protein